VYSIERILRETWIARTEYLPSVGSTNDVAVACNAAGESQLPLLVLADHQTAGRGRGSHRWWTGQGALTFSLLVEGAMLGAGCERSPLVSLAVAAAVAEIVAAYLPSQSVGIHWPNDVFTGGRKIAGILIEVLPDRRHVIGIGVNVNNTSADAPGELQSTVATLRDLSGQTHDPTEFLIQLLQQLEREWAQLRENPAVVAKHADALCLQCGQTLTLEWATQTVLGACRGIAEDGALLLETPNGIKAFYSGVLSRTL
jgi:BirA family biotin operon repressor/biotin-[acetyl-CoA-carboxylase] ligase